MKRIDFNQRMDFFVKFLEISLTTQVKQKFSKRIQIMIKIPTRTGFILNKSWFNYNKNLPKVLNDSNPNKNKLNFSRKKNSIRIKNST